MRGLWIRMDAWVHGVLGIVIGHWVLALFPLFFFFFSSSLALAMFVGSLFFLSSFSSPCHSAVSGRLSIVLASY
jgi:hypothetical protein